MLWRYFYSFGSAAQYGTLYQLRNAINRNNVVKKPIDRFDACEDFLILVVECHIIAATMKMLGMSSVHGIPISQYVPSGTSTLPADQRRKILNRVTGDLMDKYFEFQYNQPKKGTSTDMVLHYAKYIFSYGCFYLEFRDGIKEGDGVRLLRCQRYTLPMFLSSGRKNYSIETVNMLLQHDYVLSERQAAELI
ncbi:hypothetical protein SPONL_2037 [uncultured Candidatus Thioglobus sp.]|nr:hypothetical protein SPONL_2037 [uncultured Candidatus Thioglobus sp.]